MKLLVTGAGGFLGRYVVSTAVDRGHEVRAMIRSASRVIDDWWEDHPQIDVVRGDLRAPRNCDSILDDVDVVIHLAASKAGDLYEQFSGTVLATENLLAAMTRAQVKRLVVTSSFSVYEYLHRWAWGVLDEESTLADAPADRDEYCQTKLEQERIVREHVQQNGGHVAILRPGVIFGRDNLWTARLGMQISERVWCRTGSFAPLPLTYVENCAEAILLAAERDQREPELILNIVDDETPSQRAFMRAIRRSSAPRSIIVPIPWVLMRSSARLAWLTNLVMFRGKGKLPGLFVPARLHARCKPLRYSNTRAKAVLGWSPRYTWREGIARAVHDQKPDARETTAAVLTEPLEQVA